MSKWNSIQDKATLLRNQVNIVKQQSSELKKVINLSFVGGKDVIIIIIIIKFNFCKERATKKMPS